MHLRCRRATACSLDALTSTASSGGPAVTQDVLTVDRAERHRAPTIERTGSRVRHRASGASPLVEQRGDCDEACPERQRRPLCRHKPQRADRWLGLGKDTASCASWMAAVR
jgi:hypothetical protein